MDLEQFRIPTPISPIPQKRRKGKFLKGPIPLDWLQCAGQLSGKALHVGIVLQFLSGVQRSSKVRFSYSLAEEFGVKRHSAYRALKALEERGLIKIRRGIGKNPIVRLEEYVIKQSSNSFNMVETTGGSSEPGGAFSV